jgi:putative tricarboxylic transport membrane protein
VGRELLCGVLTLAVGVVYFAAATSLPQSMLSDEVGADGVPKALAVVLMTLGILQLVRAGRRYKIAGAGEFTGTLKEHAQAFGMLTIGVVYIVLAPYLGYPIAVTALIVAVALYAGLPPSWELAVVGIGGGAMLWLLFVKLLGVAMPVGLAGRLLG